MHYSHLLVQEMFLKYWQASFQPKYVTINKNFSCSYVLIIILISYLVSLNAMKSLLGALVFNYNERTTKFVEC